MNVSENFITMHEVGTRFHSFHKNLKGYNQEPGFNRLHFQAPKTQFLCKWKAKPQQKFSVGAKTIAVYKAGLTHWQCNLQSHTQTKRGRGAQSQLANDFVSKYFHEASLKPCLSSLLCIQLETKPSQAHKFQS